VILMLVLNRKSRASPSEPEDPDNACVEVAKRARRSWISPRALRVFPQGWLRCLEIG